MSSLSEAEIRGDWNNLKGTEYHLVYVLWLLLCEEAAFAAFYRGNDLLAAPLLNGSDEELPVIPLKTRQRDEDIWIQLKATSSEWTPSDFFEDNLLINFIKNAFQSQREGKKWSVRLITQGQVQRAKLENFISDPELNRNLNNSFQRVVSVAQQQLREAGFSESEIEDNKLRGISLTILSQLAQTRPVRLETLKAEIKEVIAYAYPDRRLVKRLADTLIGALLNDAAGGPARARAYDAEWLNNAAGMPLVMRGRLDTNPITACADAVQRALPLDWNTTQYCPRPRVLLSFYL